MSETIPKRSSNFKQVASAETNDADRFVKPLLVDPSTGRLLVDASVTVSGLATAVTDGEAVDAADTGNLALGTDGSSYQIIKTDASGELQIDVLTMPTVAVTQSGTWDEVGINDSGNSITVDATNLDIRDLTNADVVTAELSAVDNAVLDTIAAKDFATQTTLAAMNAKMVTGTDIGDVTINNSTGAAAVNIQDGGNAITVDYATTGSGTATGALRVELPTNGTGTVGLNAGTNAIGKLTANTGVDIGDVDVTSVVPGTGATNLGKAEDAGHTTGDVGVFNLGVRVDSPNVALTNTDADYSPITTNKLGSLRTAALEDDLATAATTHTYKYYTNAGAVTDGIIWSPAAGKRWFLTSLTINVSAAATVTIEDDVAAGDVVRFKFELAANSGVSIPMPIPMFSGEDAADLLVTTTAGNVYITCVGYEI